MLSDSRPVRMLFAPLVLMASESQISIDIIRANSEHVECRVMESGHATVIKVYGAIATRSNENEE